MPLPPPLSSHRPLRLAIIGSGFSGVSAACHALRNAAPGSSLTLYNASGPLARGLAYGTASDCHVLNVPAARMSMEADDPEHFLRWLQARGHDLAPQDFVSRRLYGDYLYASLMAAAAERPDVQLQWVTGTVSDIHETANGFLLQSSAPAGSALHDKVLLALGHFAPRPPLPQLALLDERRYVNDPWAPHATHGLVTDDPVLLIGTGLTMLDLVLSLQQRGHRGPVLALSRRGLLPQGHRSNELPPPQAALAPELLQADATLLARLRAFRRMSRDSADWRDAWGAFRAHTAQAWAQLPERARAQFLRHLQPYWDVHRHRAAPAAMRALQAHLDAGLLRMQAGRLLDANASEHGVQVRWRQRGDSQTQHVEVARVINCTGPSSRVDALASPLLWSLAQQGRLLPCPLGLGLKVDSQYRLLDAQGQGQRGLHYLGPLLKASHWEATAVPELRIHARDAVRAMLQSEN